MGEGSSDVATELFSPSVVVVRRLRVQLFVSVLLITQFDQEFVPDDDIEAIDIVDALIYAPTFAKHPGEPAKVKIPRNKIVEVILVRK